MIRRLEAGDVPACASLHQRAFPSFFLSQLGPRFLREFYRGFLGDPEAVALVAEDGSGGIAGVVVGTHAPAGFFSRLLKRRFVGFALASLLAVVRRPSSLPRLLRAVSYRGQVPIEVRGALLSSICVDPDGQGSGFGTQLIRAFEREVDRQSGHAYLVTDRSDNEAANAFYQRNGWTLAGAYTTAEGRAMNCYTYTTSEDSTHDR
ncbi:GNAT family N-acetyltransferase [Nocardioides jishulii]|uniref:GNAT family N-acetyltransferase n=2 Tax=Nocardioides jishulii TaxID=2575440 RepID=A0A4U2YTT9_9ACTN|nr:GNAT family N-acetyltransferase [Nocardioides jishulii]TKI64839.1 GNAT family N-acetyltransferase [Nocardioides jishulii]